MPGEMVYGLWRRCRQTLAGLARQGENTLVNQNRDLRYRDNSMPGVLLGVLIGSLAGALTMLLLAPQSGRDTRAQIQEKGARLRDSATGTMQDAVGQIRLSRTKIAMGGRRSPQDFLHHGQVLVARRLDHASGAALAGRTAMQSS